MIETLLGGVFGGVLRLAPEVLKWFDRKDERLHELRLLNMEMQFAKTKAEVAMHQIDAQLTVAELDTMATAFKEQAETAKSAGRFVAAFSAMVRPSVTYLFISIYALVKLAAYTIAIQQGGSWAEVMVGLWSTDDMAVLNMILTFWFVGRVYERLNR